MCGKWFSTRATLMKHRIWHHKNEFPNFKYNCELCPYATNEMTNYKNHSAVHDSLRPYQCNVCGNRFKALSSLNNHVLIHNGEQGHAFGIAANSPNIFGRLS